MSTIMSEALAESLLADEESGTLSDHVFRCIQSAIVRGEIAPGSKISEPELARAYGISRGPLREAIRRWKASACWCAYRMPVRGWCR